MRKTLLKLLILSLILITALTACRPDSPPAQPPSTVSSDDNAFTPTDTTAETVIRQRGNTVGNIVNYGLIAMSDGWIYYHNPTVGGYLFKMRIDGSERTKLNEDASFFINVMGDWIYYREFCIFLY